MLSSSLRRAAWMPVSSSLPSASRPSSQSLAASATSNGLLCAARPVQQRRYSSSSKPPVPPSDGSRGIDTSSQTPAKSVNSSGEKREGKATRRRGSREHGGGRQQKSSQQAAFSNPPSVPSTQHLQPHAADVHVASFFSIHRPISITASVPPTSNTEAFDSLFSSKRPARTTDPADVILTLSTAARSLENAAAEEDMNDAAAGGYGHFDAGGGGDQYDAIDASNMYISVEEYARRLRPFHPPPPPAPASDSASAVDSASSVDESSSSSSSKSSMYDAQTSPFVRPDDMNAPPAAGSEGDASVDVPNGAGVGYVERPHEDRSMHVISTKRRRRLKMKKHKYKKLLRRTRTLRRKLDKA